MAGEETKKSATRMAAEAAIAAENEARAKKKASSAANSATKEAAMAALAEGGSLSNTKIEEPPGFFNQLGHKVKRGFQSFAGTELPSEGDYDPKLEQASDMMRMGLPGMLAAAPTGLIGMLDTLANRDERLGEVTPLTTAATALADTASIGTLNRAGASIDTMLGNAPRGSSDIETLSALWQRQTGGDMATYAEQLDARALEQEEIRAANPTAAFGGDVLGAVATGSVIAKGAYNLLARGGGKAAQWTTSTSLRRIGFGAGIGGTETFAYSLNKNGDLVKAAGDAALATVGGAVIGGALAGVTTLGRRIAGYRSADAVQDGVGRAFLANINVDRAQQGLPPATPSEVMKTIDDLGPDATLMDAYPSLKKFANMFIGTDTTKTDAQALYDLLRQRATFQADLMSPEGGLRDAFGAKVVRSFDTLSKQITTRFKDLQPKYSVIYKDNADLTFSAKQLTTDLLETLGAKSRRGGGQIQLASDLRKQIEVFQKQATRAKGSKELPDDLTLEQVVNLKQWLQDSIGVKSATISGKAKTVPLTKSAIRDYTKATKYLEERLNIAVPELEPLNKSYGDLASTLTGYKAGEKAFASKAQDSAAVAAFMAGDNSMAAKRAFVEGAKFHMFTKFGDASVESIDKLLADNRPMMLKMEGLFGKEAATEIVDAARAMATKVKTAKDLGRSVQVASTGDMLGDETGLKGLLDAGIAVAGVPGLTSKAGALGALSRLTSGGPNAAALSKTSQYGSDILTRMGEGASEAFQELQRMTERSALASQGYEAVLPAGIGAVGGAAMNESANRDGVVP